MPQSRNPTKNSTLIYAEKKKKKVPEISPITYPRTHPKQKIKVELQKYNSKKGSKNWKPTTLAQQEFEE